MFLNFYFKRGLVETTIPWNRPKWKPVFMYFSYIRDNSDILDRYELYIVGGFLHYMHDTWDIDVNMIGEYESYEQLERDQNYLLDVSLNRFRLLTDVKLVDNLYPGTTYEDMNSVSTKVVSIEVKNFFKIFQGEVVDFVDHRRIPEVSEKLTDNLYKVTKKYIYKNKKIDFLKTLKEPGVQIMNIKEFLSLSETEFYKKINNKYDRTEVNQDGSSKFKRQFQTILPS